MINSEILNNILQTPIIRDILLGGSGLALATTIFRTAPGYIVRKAVELEPGRYGAGEFTSSDEEVIIPTGATAMIELAWRGLSKGYLKVADFRARAGREAHSELSWATKIGGKYPAKPPFNKIWGDTRDGQNHKIIDMKLNQPMGYITRNE
jgi:hypothetical protein